MHICMQVFILYLLTGVFSLHLSLTLFLSLEWIKSMMSLFSARVSRSASWVVSSLSMASRWVYICSFKTCNCSNAQHKGGLVYKWMNNYFLGLTYEGFAHGSEWLLWRRVVVSQSRAGIYSVLLPLYFLQACIFLYFFNLLSGICWCFHELMYYSIVIQAFQRQWNTAGEFGFEQRVQCRHDSKGRLIKSNIC